MNATKQEQLCNSKSDMRSTRSTTPSDYFSWLAADAAASAVAARAARSSTDARSESARNRAALRRNQKRYATVRSESWSSCSGSFARMTDVSAVAAGGTATFARKPPKTAVEAFKAVAVVDGRLLSIFDGTTEYALHETRCLESGIWVCGSLTDCVAHAEHLPPMCALRDAPRAFLRVLCWNVDGSPAAAAAGERKMKVGCVLPLERRREGMAWEAPARAAAAQEAAASDHAALPSPSSPSQAPVTEPLPPNSLTSADDGVSKWNRPFLRKQQFAEFSGVTQAGR